MLEKDSICQLWGINLFKRIAKSIFGREPALSANEIGTEVEQSKDSNRPLEVILVDDSELVVVGDESDVESYLLQFSDSGPSTPFSLSNVVNETMVANFANVAEASFEAANQHGRWLKLTKESASQVKAAGLLKTKVPGVNYGMTGEFGKSGKWLTFESSSLFNNPAVLASVSSMVAQMAISSELAVMKEMLKTIDKKLDSIARHQRDLQLAKLDRVTFALQDAQIRADALGGSVNSLTWSRIQGESSVIDETQGVALRSIEAALDETRGASVKELGKLSTKLGQEFSVWLSVLGRTLELRDQLAIVELSRTSSMPHEEALNHRASVRRALDERRRIISKEVEKYSRELQELAPMAFKEVVLHAPSSRKLTLGLNAALQVTSEFGRLLGQELETPSLEPEPWLRAALDPQQRKAAVNQVVDPIVESTKDAATAAKKIAKEIRTEIKKRGD